MIAITNLLKDYSPSTPNAAFLFTFIDETTGDVVNDREMEIDMSAFPGFPTLTKEVIRNGLIAAVLNYANNVQSYGMTADDIFGIHDSFLEWAPVAFSGDYNDLLNKPTIPSAPSSLSFANPSRSLNTAFQVSSTRASYVNYSVDIATTVSLAGGQVGTVYLEYADDSGFTTNVKEVGRFVNGQTGTLVVGLTLNQTNTAQVQGVVPAGKYVRLRTQNNTGTPTFTFRSAQEVLLASN